MILPINSLINPLLYDSRIIDSAGEHCRTLFEYFRHCKMVNKKESTEKSTCDTLSSDDIQDTPAHDIQDTPA